MSRTRIVATIGPATCSAERLRELVAAGMNVARLNGSHANHAWHKATIALLRATVPEVPILLDIPGRKIRTAALAHEPRFSCGDRIILTTDTSHDGREKVPVNYAGLHQDVKSGNQILADDGTLRFMVESVVGRDIVCIAETAGILRSRKGINVPYVSLGTALVTPRDEEMVAFARNNGVDFIGISFVESAAHVEAIRALADDSWPRIVSKVENQGGVEHVDEIVAATDVIMIDRGDLSVETNLETLAVQQKRIIAAAQRAGKPVIVATEMLHTMIENPFPTKAEVSDITNAVLDGCAATMLSGETAVGAYPLEAVSLMRRVSDAAEAYLQDNLTACGRTDQTTVPQVIEDAIALICRSLPVTKIVAVTRSGFAARMISARQVRQPILAVSNDAHAARSFNMLAGVTGVHVDIQFSKTSTDHIVVCMERLWQRGLLSNDDLILCTAVGYPQSGNRMNLLQTHHVSDLVATLGWRK